MDRSATGPLPSPVMSHPAAPKDLKSLHRFKFERILNEDTLTHTVIFLGYLPEPEEDEDVQAIVRIEKTAIDPVQVPSIFQSLSGIDKVELEQSTDIVRVLDQNMITQMMTIFATPH